MLEDLAPDAVIADKGYDSDAFLERLKARDIVCRTSQMRLSCCAANRAGRVDRLDQTAASEC